ncbi:hypothetical protein [Gemmatimonas aurantiaca]|uniref:hypothetical protein n=1 Tax=Gemmatimonas aurantiaca TaxID=173480 RepID=UPI00301BDDC3
MHKGLSAGLASVSMAAVLFAGNALSAKSAPVVSWDACTATPAQQVAVRTGEQDVRVTVSEALTDSTVVANVARESNLRVISVTRDSDMSVTLKVDASAATAGAWALTLTAGTTVCTGEVKVATAE